MLNQTGSCVAGCHRTSAAEWLNFSCLELRRAIKEAIEIHTRARCFGDTRLGLDAFVFTSVLLSLAECRDYSLSSDRLE